MLRFFSTKRKKTEQLSFGMMFRAAVLLVVALLGAMSLVSQLTQNDLEHGRLVMLRRKEAEVSYDSDLSTIGALLSDPLKALWLENQFVAALLRMATRGDSDTVPAEAMMSQEVGVARRSTATALLLSPTVLLLPDDTKQVALFQGMASHALKRHLQLRNIRCDFCFERAHLVEEAVRSIAKERIATLRVMSQLTLLQTAATQKFSVLMVRSEVAVEEGAAYTAAVQFEDRLSCTSRPFANGTRVCEDRGPTM